MKRSPAKVRRRTMLRGGGAIAASALTASAWPRRAAASDESAALQGLLRDPKGILDLPAGFGYRVVQRAGEPMSDAFRVPGRPDAMGCFPGPSGRVIVMRNHEVTPGDTAHGPYVPGQAPPPESYDPEGYGGVSRLVLDADTLALQRSNLVLCGTHWNCAGGLSPWGWLSCEEIAERPRHGYVFLCATDADRVQPPRPIPVYGRMRHEAASADARTHIAYLTEDQTDGGFYRFVPKSPERPFEGVLQALRIAGRPRFQTSDMPQGERLAIDWVDVDTPDPEDDSVRAQAQAKGAAVVRRGEGLWLAGDRAFFCATAGGAAGRGQVFELTFGSNASLRVVAASTDPDVLDMPDNICVSPLGQLYAAEDGMFGNFVRRISLDGEVLPFARNAVSSSEFAGPCFSPDGRTLFVNIQGDGLTLAIRGPFERPLPNEGRTSRGPLHEPPNLARGVRGLGTGLAVLALAAFARRRKRAARG
ncbi:MAG: alkaline phosphatase PhoX [Polyangiales bacterium]